MGFKAVRSLGLSPHPSARLASLGVSALSIESLEAEEAVDELLDSSRHRGPLGFKLL
jgi:hypothetical protein